jgi:hypothetical protein
LIERLLHSIVGHFEEQQIGELRRIVALAQAFTAQHAGAVPEFLDEGVGAHVIGNSEIC